MKGRMGKGRKGGRTEGREGGREGGREAYLDLPFVGRQVDDEDKGVVVFDLLHCRF
jgi:hypothetical protein